MLRLRCRWCPINSLLSRIKRKKNVTKCCWFFKIAVHFLFLYSHCSILTVFQFHALAGFSLFCQVVCRVAVATQFQRAFMQLLYDAQFEELSARDLMLTSALNTDYLLTLPIYVDWKKASESNAIIFKWVLVIDLLIPFSSSS